MVRRRWIAPARRPHHRATSSGRTQPGGQGKALLVATGEPPRYLGDQLRKLITAVMLGVGVVAMSTAAFAGDIGPIGHFETGKGKDAPCPTGGTCPTPADPSGGDASLVPGPVSVGQDGDPAAQQGHVFVAIGDEGAANSLGRVSFGGSAADGAQLYAEDYT